MLNENVYGSPMGGHNFMKSEQLFHQGIADFNAYKSEFLSQISVLLYNSENLKLIKTVEETIPDFFINYTDLRMMLLKLEFFNLMLDDASQEILINFYNQYFLDLVTQNTRYSKTGDFLHFISMHPEIIKNRYYQTKFEEVCNIFLIAMEKAFIQIFFPGNQYVDPRHTCQGKMEEINLNCLACVDGYSFIANYERVFLIEEDICMFYRQNVYLFLTTHENSSATNSKSSYFDFISFSDNNVDSFYSKGMNLDYYDFDNNELNFDCLKEKETDLLNNININITNLKVEIPQPLEQHIIDQPMNQQMDQTESTHSNTKCLRQKFLVNKFNNINNITNLKKDQRQKYKIPFFKDFNFKFTKRENIDKKILRKSRKFLKEKIKKNKINLDAFNLTETQKNFWINYFTLNLLPPMKYNDKETKELIEFKSFNTNYMVWLFSHKGSVELYELYLAEKFDDLIDTFYTKFNLDDPEEANQLADYIKNIVNVFQNEKESQLDVNEDNYGTCYNEEIIDTWVPDMNTDFDYKEKKNNIFGDMEFENIILIKNGPCFNNKLFENSLERSEDLGKMFNNSFGCDEIMFNDE